MKHGKKGDAARFDQPNYQCFRKVEARRDPFLIWM
jgi:hypothetical protein